MPDELWQGSAALRSFVQVPIGDPAAPRGVLLLATQGPSSFDCPSWQVKLQVASTGLLPHVRHAQVESMAHLLKAMHDTPDPVALISVLLRSAARYMHRACGMRCSVRLALVQQDDGKALLFEAPRAAGGPSPLAALVSPADVSADVVASSLGLNNTLLASAVGQRQARFVADIGTYMQVRASLAPPFCCFTFKTRANPSPATPACSLLAAARHPLVCTADARYSPTHRTLCAPRATCSRASASWCHPLWWSLSSPAPTHRRWAASTLQPTRRPSLPTTATRCW